MNEPEVRQYGESYDYLWHDAGFGIGFAGLRESKGELHGEIWVGSSDPTCKNGHVVWGSFNLSSPMTRSKMALQCHTRTKQLTAEQWISMFEYVCLVTAENFRKGEPLIDLSTLEPVFDVRYLVRPILAENEITSIFADGNSGKGFIGLGVAIGLALGGSLGAMVIPGFTPVRQARTLYLDWETSAYENVRRQVFLCRGLDLDTRPPGIYYRHMTRPLSDDIAIVRSLVDREKIDLVIVDSAGVATGGEVNDSEPTLRMMAALRLLKATKLILGHVSKATAANKSSDRGRMIGSIFFENLSRACWEVRADPDENPNIMGFFHRKANMGAKQKPFALSLTFTDANHSCRFQPAELNDSPVVAEHAPLSVRLAAALRRGPREVEDLAEELTVSPATVRTTLNRAHAKGVVVQLADRTGQGVGRAKSRWALAAHEERA